MLLELVWLDVCRILRNTYFENHDIYNISWKSSNIDTWKTWTFVWCYPNKRWYTSLITTEYWHGLKLQIKGVGLGYFKTDITSKNSGNYSPWKLKTENFSFLIHINVLSMVKGRMQTEKSVFWPLAIIKGALEFHNQTLQDARETKEDSIMYKKIKKPWMWNSLRLYRTSLTEMRWEWRSSKQSQSIEDWQDREI